MNYNNINQIINHSGWITKLSTFLSIINSLSCLHPILNLGIVVIILIFFDKKRNFSQEFCTDIRFFYGAKKVHKKMAAVYKNSAAGLLGVHNLSTEKNR